MTAVITANLPASRDSRAPAPATHEDGTNYAWRMFYDDGRTIADADTLADLIECLLPGYSSLDDAKAELGARIVIAKSAQLQVRSEILANLSAEKIESLSEWERAVLMWDKDDTLDPYGWGDGTGELGTRSTAHDVWVSSVPLVLVSTSYEGKGGIPRPISIHGDFFANTPNLIWLRPETEHSLLESLSNVGIITFGEP